MIEEKIIKQYEDEGEDNFSFKNLFAPLTIKKAVYIILSLGFIVFFHVLFNGFVWDDKVYVLNNPDVRTLNIGHLFGPNNWNNGLFYRPLAGLYYSILYLLFGYTAFFYHIIQVLLHIANAILLFIIFQKFINKYISLFLAVIFLIHPIQVESAAFISTTLSPLSMLFGITAIMVSFKDIISFKRLSLIFILLLGAILVRETGAIFVALIFVYKLLSQFKKKHLIAYSLLGLIVASLYLFLRFVVGGVHPSIAMAKIVPIAGLTLSQRIINVPSIVFYYIKTFFYPDALAINQQWITTTIDFNSFYLPLLFNSIFFLVIFFLGIYLFRNKNQFKSYIYFLSWFLLGLFFHIQIYPLDMTVADRFFYLPIIGLLGIIGLAVESIIARYKNNNLRAIGYTIAICLIVILSIRTMVRTANWYDEFTLYTHDLKIYESRDIVTNLGNIYFSKQDYKNALRLFRRSAEIYPTELNFYNIGYTYEQLGDFRQSIEYYSKSLGLNRYPLGDHKLIRSTTARRIGFVYLRINENLAAKDILKKMLVEFPDNGYLWEYLAISEYRLNNYDEAIKSIKKAKSYLSNKEVEYAYTQIINKQPIDFP